MEVAGRIAIAIAVIGAMVWVYRFTRDRVNNAKRDADWGIYWGIYGLGLAIPFGGVAGGAVIYRIGATLGAEALGTAIGVTLMALCFAIYMGLITARSSP